MGFSPHSKWLNRTRALALLFIENSEALTPDKWFVSEDLADKLRAKAMAGNAPGTS